MQNSSIVRLLNTFSENEMRSLEKYVNSPAHNLRSDVQRLFDYFRKNHKKKVLPETDDLLLKVFTTEKADIKQLHLVKTYLMRVIESWMIQQELEEEKVFQQRLLARAYRRRHLEEVAGRVLKEVQDETNNSICKDYAYFDANYKIKIDALYLDEKQSRAKSLDLQTIVNSQDIAFIYEKLKNACTLLSHQAVSREAYDTGLLNTVLQWLEEGHPFLENPTLSAYFHAYFATKDENGDFHFSVLKKILTDHAALFSSEERRNVYLLAINFCIKRLNSTQTQYVREVFDLYQHGIKHEVFLENGLLSRFTFNNITAAGLNLKEYDWVRQFIDKYQFFLSENHREATYHFNIARYYYEIGNRKAAQEHLRQMGYDDALQNMTAKYLLAKIYFETNEFGALDSLLDSISAYARRSKGMGYHRDITLTFVRFLRKVMAISSGHFAEKETLVAAIQSAKGLPEKGWFLGLLK
jgi:hypothetical protein